MMPSVASQIWERRLGDVPERSGRVLAFWLGDGQRKERGHVLDVLRTTQVRRLPVLDANDHLIGMLSLADVAREADREHGRRNAEMKDADIAQTMIDYSSQSAVYQAALKAGSMLIQPSLVDFLN